MRVGASWKDSLTIFKPSNLKLFCLVTLKSIIETTKTWLRYWGWLVVVLCTFVAIKKPIVALLTVFAAGFAEIIVRSMIFITSQESMALNGIGMLLVMALIIALCLSVRPSTRLKNSSYFLSYYVHALYTVLWFTLLSVLCTYVLYILLLSGSGTANKNTVIALVSTGITLVLTLCAPSITLFYLSFLYDTDGSFKNMLRSVRRAFLMFMYNVPFCLIATFLVALFCIGILVLFDAVVKVSGLHDTVIYDASRTALKLVVCFPVMVNVANNFYVKRLHEQFNLYFE